MVLFNYLEEYARFITKSCLDYGMTTPTNIPKIEDQIIAIIVNSQKLFFFFFFCAI